MATISRRLPAQPHLDIPKREARELLMLWRQGRTEGLERLRQSHPKFARVEPTAVQTESLKLADAQRVIAREYGFGNWAEMKCRIAGNQVAEALLRAIRDDDRNQVMDLLRHHPEMMHVPLWSGNWGPPMSHAANLGKLEIVQVIDSLGARDHQHAFDRALLQGQIECARWLHQHGAKLMPGIVMGSCETHKAAGFEFLLSLGAQLTDASGHSLAPLALTLETYTRNPAGKHLILDLFEKKGYTLPSTPTMAVHRGDTQRLEAHWRRDPNLFERRFSLSEIYPPECGCAPDGLSGMHWTPLAGATLLHIAVDFREDAIVRWLLARGANPNARALPTAASWGGHTALFNAVVNGPWSDQTTIPALLEAGADPRLRATLRKFLDWREKPYWHEASDVTAVEWAVTFPDSNWVNKETSALLPPG